MCEYTLLLEIILEKDFICCLKNVPAYFYMNIFFYANLSTMCKKPIYKSIHIMHTINPGEKAYIMYVDYETTLQKRAFVDVF